MTDPVAHALAAQLYAAVGAFFCNTRRSAANVCPVCTGPGYPNSQSGMCAQCRGAQETFGGKLADLVVPLAYAKAYMPSIHQSAHHVRAYKASPPHRSAHKICGIVPAAARPGGDHPVAEPTGAPTSSTHRQPRSR